MHKVLSSSHNVGHLIFQIYRKHASDKSLDVMHCGECNSGNDSTCSNIAEIDTQAFCFQ